MKLDDFVSETLQQIIKGISNAKEFGATHGAQINPISIRPSGTDGRSYCKITGAPIQLVSFDVALTVSQESSTSGPEARVGSISVSSADTNTTQNSSISRIKFEIPVMFPTTGSNRL